MPKRRDEELLRAVGRRAAELRLSRGLSQEKLAELLGLEPVSLSRLETGARGVSLSMLAAIAQALGVRLADLLDEASPMAELDASADLTEAVRLLSGMPKEKRKLVLRLLKDLAPI